LTPTLPVVLVVAAAAFLVGVGKGGLSGFGPMLTVLVSTAMPPTVAIGVLLPLLIVGDVFALWAHWGGWDRSLLARLLPGGIVGVGAASFSLSAISERALELVLVGVTAAFILYRLVETRLPDLELRPRSWHGVVAGASSGVTSTIAHAGGPPVAIYLLLTRTTSRHYVATSALFFAVVNWLKVPGYVGAGVFDAELTLRLAPTALLIPPGILIGRSAIRRISQQAFDRFILASLVGGAILLLID
jgi:hypothetical protein